LNLSSIQKYQHRHWAYTSLGLVLTMAVLASPATQANPETERQAFVAYYEKLFPQLSLDDYGNGQYALDPDARANWEAIEVYPPYQLAVDEGKTLFETPFKNGQTYAECFAKPGIKIRQNYPYFDAKTGQVRTLEQEINACLEQNGEAPLPWERGQLASISAYLSFISRGQKIEIKIPKEESGALAAYEKGKQFYYAKRGQLNFSCADCHVYSAGKHLRSEVLSPGLGHATHFPVYRSEWGEMGTLHRRFAGCNELIRAKRFKAQSEEYRNLEYFMTYMNNGLSLNGPAARK